MALGRGKLIGVIGDEDTCVGKPESQLSNLPLLNI